MKRFFLLLLIAALLLPLVGCQKSCKNKNKGPAEPTPAAPVTDDTSYYPFSQLGDVSA